MLAIKNVPIVIEPGIEVLEVELAIEDLRPTDSKQVSRRVPMHLYRVPLDSKAARALPLIPTTRIPHVFSATTNIEKTPALVVYDSLGRISTVYTRGNNQTWERFDVAEEHAGKSVTQFSVRFVFNTVKDRAKFLELTERMVEGVSQELAPQMDDVMAAMRILARSRVAPVLLPVASEKCTMSKIKL